MLMSSSSACSSLTLPFISHAYVICFCVFFSHTPTMCFCDPLFVAVHSLYHLSHFCYLVIKYTSCVGQPVGSRHPQLHITCQFGGKPWLAYQELYLSTHPRTLPPPPSHPPPSPSPFPGFVLSGSTTFTFLLLFSCFVHEGGVFVGVGLATFKRFKWHGVCLCLNLALLLPAIITHSIPMIVVYSPFVIALCAGLALSVLACTWLMNFLWERSGERAMCVCMCICLCLLAAPTPHAVSALNASRVMRSGCFGCDGRAMLLLMQIVMKVLAAHRTQPLKTKP